MHSSALAFALVLSPPSLEVEQLWSALRMKGVHRGAGGGYWGAGIRKEPTPARADFTPDF